MLVGQTTASEFGGVNVTRTVLNGTTHNPWQHGRTPGGSSGGSAAAVAGGLVTLGTGGDGGGSIRIPAGFVGMVGLKATYGRIPLTPKAGLGAMTVTHGCLSRWFATPPDGSTSAMGTTRAEPLSLPRVEGWEAGLGTHLGELRAKRVAIVPDWGAAVVSPVMWELLEEAAIALIDDCGMVRVGGVDTELPRMGAAWSVANSVGLINQLQDHWPECADDLTPEIRRSMETAPGLYGADARIKLETRRTELNEAMARIFDVAAGGVDFVITASNPDVAFDADGPLPNTFGGVKAGAKINGRLTFPANMSLSCWIRGSGSAWEDGWVAPEGEEGEGDEGFGSVEAEGDAGEEPDLGVGGLDEAVGETRVEGVVDRLSVFDDLAGEFDVGRHS